MDRLLPVESLPQIDFENTRNKDADETVRGVIQTIQKQISMKTNRVAFHTTKTKVTMEVTNMQKVIAKTKI